MDQQHKEEIIQIE